MTYTIETVKAIMDEAYDDYGYVGIRFEDKPREVGDVCDNSRHNPDRDAERDFPAWGGSDYDDLPELDGTSAYCPDYLPRLTDDNLLDSDTRMADHCYIIASDSLGYHYDPDAGEILLRDPQVMRILW